jgi:hypothetical protein
MIVIKDGKEVTDFIIQEGVPTFESIKRRGRAGGVHDRPLRGAASTASTRKGIDQNLNAPGSQYVPLAFAQQHAVPDLKAKPGTARRTASMSTWWRAWRCWRRRWKWNAPTRIRRCINALSPRALGRSTGYPTGRPMKIAFLLTRCRPLKPTRTPPTP